MSDLNITNLVWTTETPNVIGGGGRQHKTGLRSATARCGCGHEWRASATKRPTYATGEIFEHMGGLEATCPSCCKTLKLDGQRYTQLYR